MTQYAQNAGYPVTASITCGATKPNLRGTWGEREVDGPHWFELHATSVPPRSRRQPVQSSASWSAERGRTVVGRLLIWLSGARRQILDECPTERPKYVGIGASILITATMAAVSLAFALVTALKVEFWLAIPFAIAWGLAILSLDRLFVVSMSRNGKWPAQLLRATPRVLLALLLGFVISTPFVLQIFRPEIEHEITILHTQAANAYLAGARNSPLQQQITQYQTEVDKLTVKEGSGGPPPQSPQLQSTLDQLHEAEATETGAYNQWQCQLYGPCQPAGNGPLATADQQRYYNYAAQVTQLARTASSEQNQLDQNSASTQAKNKAEAETQLPPAQKALQAAQNEQAQEESTFTTQNENNGGLLIRLQALDAVTSHDSTLNAARWLLFLLFVVIDCMPVMIKVMLNLGPANNYDRLLEAEEQKQRRVAANNTEFREAAEMMAAGTVISEPQSWLAGWSADIPEVTQNIIATRRRVAAKTLKAWENAQIRSLRGKDAAMPGQTTDVEPPVGSSAMPADAPAEPRRRWQYLAWLQRLRPRRASDGPQPQDAHASGQQSMSAPRSPDTAQVNSGNPDKSPQAEYPDGHRRRKSRDLTAKFAIPLAIGAATIVLGFLQFHIAGEQYQDNIVETYQGDIRGLLSQHLSTSKPGDEVRQIATEDTVSTLKRLNAQRNGMVLQFLRDAGLFGPQNEAIDLNGADLRGAHLKGVNLTGVAMSGADLTGADLSGATLTGASLNDASLNDADLSGAHLGSAILTSADLAGADLTGADLAGADLAGARIAKSQLADVRSCADAILPTGGKCLHKPTIWLTYWYTESPAEAPVVLDLVSEFNKNNPKIHINAVRADFFNARAAFTSAVHEGDAPDIFRSDVSWTPLFASEGYLLNLDKYVPTSELSDYQNAPVSTTRGIPPSTTSTDGSVLSAPLVYDEYKGDLYGLPQEIDFPALLYNRNELQEAGIDAPPVTMDTLSEDAVKIVERTKKTKATYGFEFGGTAYYALPFLYACGGGMFDHYDNIVVNNTSSVAGLKFLMKLQKADNGKVMPPVMSSSTALTNMELDFKKGTTAMIFDGPHEISDILTGKGSVFKGQRDNLGIAPIPTGLAGQTGSPLGGESYVISADTAHPDEAYEFIKFMSSTPSQVAMANANFTLPTRQSAYRDLASNDRSSYQFISEFVKPPIKDTVVAPLPVPQAGHLLDVADPYILAALTGKQSAAEALNAIAYSWNQLGAGKFLQSTFRPGASSMACS